MTKRRNRIHSLHTVVVDVESDESRVKGTVESTNTLGDGAAAPNVTGDGAGGDRFAVVPGTAAVDLAASFGFIGHVRELCPLPWQWPHWYPDPTPDARPELVRTTRGRPRPRLTGSKDVGGRRGSSAESVTPASPSGPCSFKYAALPGVADDP